MAAFRRAFDEGYRYLETDVQATADGVLVAFHDPRLDRVTDRHGPIAELPWSEVRQARIGGTEPIPLLADLLEELPDARFNIDAKAAGRGRRRWRSWSGKPEPPTGSASVRSPTADWPPCGTARTRMSPPRSGPREIFRLVRASALRRRFRTTAVAAQVPTSVPAACRSSLPGSSTTAHAAGLEVHVWTIDDPAEMRRLLDLGVDGIMTDRPELLRDVLIESGAPGPDPPFAPIRSAA